MNRFRETIDDLKRRARLDPQIEDVTRDYRRQESAIKEQRAPKYRLPYSSDPEPVGETWATDD
jgi:hypothetical protein